MISVFVPSHITGFFSIFDNEDPLLKGSLGAGVLLDKGVITEIGSMDEFDLSHKGSDFLDDNSDLLNADSDLFLEENNPLILINGKKDEYNQVIVLKTIEIMENELSFSYDDLRDILISQEIQVPIGCGFGTSASSAIGTAICLNEFLDLGLSIDECGKYAHLAELSLSTGLGDVIAELSRGIVLRTREGAPTIGQTRSLVPHESNVLGNIVLNDSCFYVLTKSLGEISTASIIDDPKYKNLIHDVGLEVQQDFDKKDDGVVIGSKFKNKFNVAFDSEFDEEETIRKFMNASLKFAKKTHLISDEILEIVYRLHGKVLGSSMAMLGNTFFAIANEEQKYKLEAEYYGEFDFYKLETHGIRISK